METWRQIETVPVNQTTLQSWRDEANVPVVTVEPADCCDVGFYCNHINVTFALDLGGLMFAKGQILSSDRRGDQIRCGRWFIRTSPSWRVVSVIRRDLNYSYRFIYIWWAVMFVDWSLQCSWIPPCSLMNCDILQLQHLHKGSAHFVCYCSLN